ncbi:MAG: hypothetical protein GSR77_00600 [Desulfurococcales archaeon]|nr:hypothetical protein [Desulfurococcales archaeon]
MQKTCNTSSRPLKILYALTITMIAALAIALLLIYSSPSSPLLKNTATAILIAFTTLVLVYHQKKYGKLVKTLKDLCKVCGGDPRYLYRRYTYYCQLDDIILAYNSVLNKLYAIRIHEVFSEKKYSPGTPLNYYTVKLYDGRTRRHDSTTLFRGEAEIVDPYTNKIIRGSMTIAYSPVESEFEALARRLLRMVNKK